MNPFETAFAVAEATVAQEQAATAGIPAPRAGEPGSPAPVAAEQVELSRPDLPELGQGAPSGPARDLRLLAEVEVQLAVELGRLRIPLRDLLSLGPGSVVELDRAADAPVDVLVNGTLVASGEVVVVDGEFGVRITSLAEPA